MNTIQNRTKLVSNIDAEIIDDIGLIDCVNKLNSLKEAGSIVATNTESLALQQQEQDVLTNIERINAEMRWFSQWLTAKVRSAA